MKNGQSDVFSSTKFIVKTNPLSGRKTIHCYACGSTSYHPQDVEYRYCARCQTFHEPPNGKGF